MANLQVIPDTTILPSPGGGVSRTTLNTSARGKDELQLTVAAAGEPEALIYGRVRIGARVGFPIVYQEALLVPCFIGLGEIDAIEGGTVNNRTSPVGVSRTDYLGTAGQTANADLVAAWAAKGKAYTDAYANRAYTVVRVPPGAENSLSSLEFVVRGKKVYDPRGNAIRADGINGFVDCGAGASITSAMTGDWTVEAWVRPQEFSNGQLQKNVVISGRRTEANQSFALCIWSNQLQTQCFSAGSPGGWNVISSDAQTGLLTLDEWAHIAVTKSGSTVSFYVNGVLFGAQKTVTYGDLSVAGNGVLFCKGFYGGTWYSKTDLDEVRLWSVARTAEQIAAYMNVRAVGDESGLQACWHADEASGTVYDATANDNDGSVSGGLTRVAGVPLDPSSSSEQGAYSTNPSLCLADLIASTTYGLGVEVDWPSVADAADYCDELVGTVPNQEKRRELNLVINRQQKTEQWVETLRSYAGVWLAEVDGKIKFVIDDAASSVMALVPGSYRLDSLSIEQVGPENAPTVVEIQYTDITSTPWNTDASKIAKLAGVDAGTVPYRESVVEWPGCQSAGMAYREALRRLKQAQLADIACKITLLDDGLRLYEGLVVSLTDNEGFSAKLFRVLKLSIGELGRPQVELGEYDAAVYSSDYVVTPTSPDSGLPSPASPDAPTALVLTEELVQQQGSGLYNSRISVSWTAPEYPFIREYRVEVTLAGAIQETGTSRDTEYTTGPLKEGVSYAVNVYTISTIGVPSAVLQGTIVLQGKDDTPSDVTGFTGREVGGRVTFEWNLVDDLDNAGYEIRYALTSLAATWDEATLLDTVYTRSNRYSNTGIPAGDWTFYIKARDGKRTVSYPGGQYSANAATVDIVVTLDTANFVSERVVFEGETLENMTEYTLRPDPAHYFVTDFLDTLGYGHADPNNATGTFEDLITKPFCVPHSAPGSPTPDSVYTSDVYDFGATINATWRVDITAYNQDALGPDPTYAVLTSTNGVDYTEHVGEQWTGEGRYARVRARCAGEGTMLVVRDSTGPALVIDAVVRSEDQVITTSASGPAVVTLQNKYLKLNSIQLTVRNDSTGSPTVLNPAFAVYDNVQLSATLTNTFDVYAFDENGVQVAVDVSVTFKGV